MEEAKGQGIEVNAVLQEMPAEWKDMKIIDQNKKYWDEINKPAIDKMIANNGDIRFIHDPRLAENQYNIISPTAKDNFSKKARAEGITKLPTFMKWEYDYLLKKGYVLLENGLMVKL